MMAIIDPKRNELTRRSVVVSGSTLFLVSLAGCQLPLFEPPAIEALFQASQGMPRKVNRLAHYALTSAAIAKERTVTDQHLQTALEEIAL